MDDLLLSGKLGAEGDVVCRYFQFHTRVILESTMVKIRYSLAGVRSLLQGFSPGNSFGTSKDARIVQCCSISKLEIVYQRLLTCKLKLP